MSLSDPRYEIVEIPGSGAYCTVCVARGTDGRLVALKVLRQHFVRNADVLKRTRDEARMLNRLRHPNIVRVDALLAIDKRPVVVMEYVEGVTLEAIVAKRRAGLPAGIAAEVCRQLSLALDAAYNSPVGPGGQPMRIVHRDIKPANILLSVAGEVKLMDFGIAKGDFAGREAQSLYFVRGSQGFMSPERADGVPDSPAVDVYALGLTIFQLVTGKQMVVSLQSDRHDEAVEKFLAYLQPEGVDDARTGELRDLVHRMCAYDRDARPAPIAVATALQRWMAAAGIAPDLKAFALQEVVPLRANRRRIPPRQHPAWRDVSFLHTEPDAPGALAPSDEQETVRPGARMSTEALNAWLRQAVARPDWPSGLAEMRTLTRGREDWSLAPFFAVLDRESVPWWQFWAAESSTRHIAAALQMLQGRSDASIIARAREYVRHADPDVSEAARNLLTSSGQGDGE